VTGAVRLMGALRHRAAVPTLIRLLDTGPGEVRTAVLEAARRIPTTPMAEAVVGCLGSPDRALRIAAARILAEIQYTPGVPVLAGILEGKELREADLTEMMAMFQAYADLAGEDAVPFLDRILNRRGFLGRREPADVRACAALALGRVGGGRALQAVEKARNDEEPVVRSAVRRAFSGESEASDA
jgi:HEAT repeat protein